MKKLILLLLILISFVTYSTEIIKTFAVPKNAVNKTFLTNFIKNKNDSLFYYDIEILEVENISRLKEGLQPLRLIKNTENLLKQQIYKFENKQYLTDSTGTYIVYPNYYKTLNFFSADSITLYFKFKIKNNNLMYRLIGLNFFFDENKNDTTHCMMREVFYYVDNLKINENILNSECKIKMQFSQLLPVIYEKSTIYFSDFELKEIFSFNYYDNNTFELSDLKFMIEFKKKFDSKNIQFTPKVNKKYIKIFPS